MADLRLVHPFSMVLAGPSQSGKSTFAGKLLQHKNELINTVINKVIYFYQAWQPLFDSLRQRGIVDEFVRGIPDEETFLKKTKGAQHSIVIIDDSMTRKDVTKLDVLFSVHSHHSSASLIFMTQNLFHKNIRDITLNCNYIVVFNNPRDQAQIVTLNKQLYPGTRFITQVYRDITKKPYSYIFIDCRQETPPSFKVRSNILPGERPMRIYLPN